MSDDKNGSRTPDAPGADRATDSGNPVSGERSQGLRRRDFLLRAALVPALCGSARAWAAPPSPPSDFRVNGQAPPATPPPPAPPSGPVSVAIVPQVSRTVWDPGIPGGVPADDASPAARQDGAGPAIQHGATIAAGASAATIQSALNAAGAVATKTSRRIVQLGPGTFVLSSGLSIPSYVILRGTSTGIGNRQTTLRATYSGSVISMWGTSGNWGAVRNVVGVAPKGASTITVDNAADFRVGDILTIDQLNDGASAGTQVPPGIQYDPPNPGSWVWWRSSLWYQRQPYSAGNGVGFLFPDSNGWRHVSERVEVLAKNGNTLTIWNGQRGQGKPLHMTYYKSPQVYRAAAGAADVLRYAGVENLRIEPFDGRVIVINGAAYCWVRNVEINGAAQRWGGRHCQLYSQTYRCEVRDSYFHQSSNYNQGGNAYGLNISGTNNLIENNVVLKHNKPIVLECSNGGNVIAYNYVDEAVIGSLTNSWQEAAISTHASYVHNELFEGNYTPNIGCDSTHGNNGFNTIFRNWCRGQNSSGYASAYRRAIFSDGWNMYLNSIGNVLWYPGNTPNYVLLTPSTASNAGYLGVTNKSAYLLGSNSFNPPGFTGWSGADNMDNGTAARFFHRHLDYVYGQPRIFDNPDNPEKALPNSLYLTGKPAFFGNLEWPWVDPAGATDADRIKTLPAKARFDAGRP